MRGITTKPLSLCYPFSPSSKKTNKIRCLTLSLVKLTFSVMLSTLELTCQQLNYQGFHSLPCFSCHLLQTSICCFFDKFHRQVDVAIHILPEEKKMTLYNTHTLHEVQHTCSGTSRYSKQDWRSEWPSTTIQLASKAHVGCSCHVWSYVPTVGVPTCFI